MMIRLNDYRRSKVPAPKVARKIAVQEETNVAIRNGKGEEVGVDAYFLGCDEGALASSFTGTTASR